MKKMTIFRIALTFAWFAIATGWAVLYFMGKEVDASCAFWPSALCFFLYLDKVIDDTKTNK